MRETGKRFEWEEHLELFKNHIAEFKIASWPEATGLCPYHDDHKPSFAMNLESGLWLCRACDKRGNAEAFSRSMGERAAKNIKDLILPSNAAAPLEAYSGGIKLNPMRMKDLIALVQELGEDKDEWFWENMIAAESVCMIVGAPKAGKSTFIAAMVAAIACGEPFLGLKTKKIKILILGLEERRRDVAKRFRQLGVTGGIRYLQGPLRATPEAYAGLADYVRRHGIRLIVIDTLANFWQIHDENSASETEKALEPIRQLARDLKVAVLLIHHSRKGEMIPGESIRGSSAIFGVVDASFSFKSGKSFDDTERTLQVQSRLSGHWQQRLDFRDGRYRVVGKNDLTAREQELFKLLRKDLQTAEEIGAPIGLRGTTARRACENLAAKLPDKVRVEGTGKKSDPKRYGLKDLNICTSKRAA